MDILGIAYLGIESPTSKAWLEYGPEVLGFGLGAPRENDETVYLRMDDRRWRIAVHPGETDRLAYIGWEARNRTAFNEGVETLKAAGYEVTLADDETVEQRAVRNVAQFVDPAGYHHELIYGQKFQPRTYTPGRPHAGFVAGDTGVGHIVLVVPKFSPELEEFAEKVMGFTWCLHGAGPGGPRGPKGGFYRAKNSPHSHNIAYMEMPGQFGIHHMGIETQEIDDVGIAWDIVQERGIPIQVTLGRHTQDPVISFYSYTPSGMIVEYLTGGLHEPDETFIEMNPEKLSVWGHKFVGGSVTPSTIGPVAVS